MEQVKQQHVDTDYSLEAVPMSARKGFGSMFVIMMGFTFFSASMSAGAKMANGMDLATFIWALLIGSLFLGIYTGLLAYIGGDTGLSFDLLAHRSFGKYGSYLPSAMIAITQIGWFGVGAAMFGYPVAEQFGVPLWILIVACGLCMTCSAYFGVKGLEIVSWISVPLIAVLGIYSMVTATVDGGGLVAIFDKSTGSMTLLGGIAAVIGSFISGGSATPNFARFGKTNKSTVIATVIAFTIGNILMFCFGAVGGAFTGKDDIFYVMIAQGLAIPAIIVLGANIWTTNDNALYTGSLGLSNITKVRKRPMVIVSGIIGTVAVQQLHRLAELPQCHPPAGRHDHHDGLLHAPRELQSRFGCGTQRELGRHCRRCCRCARRQPDERNAYPRFLLGHCGRQRDGHCRHHLLRRGSSGLQGQYRRYGERITHHTQSASGWANARPLLSAAAHVLNCWDAAHVGIMRRVKAVWDSFASFAVCLARYMPNRILKIPYVMTDRPVLLRSIYKRRPHSAKIPVFTDMLRITKS